MKKNAQAIIATLLLAGAAFSANAADASHATKVLTLNPAGGAANYTASFASSLATSTFADTFSFRVSGTSLLAADVTATGISATSGLDLAAFAVYSSNGTLLYSAVQKSNGAIDNWKLNTKNLILSAGNYYLQVNGTINGAGSLSGNIALRAVAVPEADTYAMLLAGLGLVGAVARRRKRA
ncbi:FxDxF family PEP-CTERM protein [Duganella sp. sic0402]|uniref:FxDxF family PEP-CTERM protein n=1 Tax=Duganella sp. sic0402 TaxID=2854786 RepID=UPI001C463CDD|nr:FxDxF family PEP-CTERM protein [Duganella sp. sic0402]MBV7535958.1 FxDxF family PEP-CTERM protein [Duganella sp. sic0402]